MTISEASKTYTEKEENLKKIKDILGNDIGINDIVFRKKKYDENHVIIEKRTIQLKIFGDFRDSFYLCSVLFKERTFMETKLIKYKTREEAIAAFRKMKQRKKEWLDQTDRDFKLMRESLAVIS